MKNASKELKQAEMKSLVKEWLERVEEATQKEEVEGISAYNVGLFESEDGYCAYLMGAKEYDPDDSDWACEEDYTPEERYLPISAALTEGVEWEAFLNQMVEVLKDIMPGLSASEDSMWHGRVITTGFDDGDLLRIC
ncbi:MAG: hypothetical protein LUD17_04940 [Bacteroidales bacterium]|nr:hypothetical protein [Bacteroidales bacterium]